jgi:hypothetical protein
MKKNKITKGIIMKSFWLSKLKTGWLRKKPTLLNTNKILVKI